MHNGWRNDRLDNLVINYIFVNMIILIAIIILLFLWIFYPKIDYYKDYRDHKHIILWFNWIDDRKYIHYEWAA